MPYVVAPKNPRKFYESPNRTCIVQTDYMGLFHKFFLRSQLIQQCSKLECLLLSVSSSLVQYLRARPEPTQVESGFSIVSHFYPSLIFAGKAKSLPLEWSPISGSSLACKCYTRAKMYSVEWSSIWGSTPVGSSRACKYYSWVTVTNVLAYCGKEIDKAVRNFWYMPHSNNRPRDS